MHVRRISLLLFCFVLFCFVLFCFAALHAQDSRDKCAPAELAFCGKLSAERKRQEANKTAQQWHFSSRSLSLALSLR